MTHVANFTVQGSQVTTDHTNFVVKLDLSDLGASSPFWTTVANGGGDIRCFKSDGTTELAREVVFCDTATNTGIVYVNFDGTLSSSGNTEIQVHADGASSEPAVTATYGRNAVWSDYFVVMHFRGDLEESSGNNTVTSSGTVTQNTDDMRFDGGWLDISSLSGISVGTGYHLKINGVIDAIASQASWCGQMDAGGAYSIYRSSGNTTGRVDHGSHITEGRAVFGWDGVDEVKDWTWDAANFYYNGGGATGDAGRAYSNVPTPGASMTYMRRSGNSLLGQVKELRHANVFHSDSWTKDENTNEVTPATFYAATDVSGGGTDIAANLESLSVTENAATVSSDRDITGNLESMSASTFAAGVASDRDVAQGAVEALAATAQQADIATDRDISANLEALSASQQAANISTDRDIEVTLEALAVSEQPASIALAANIDAALENVNVTANQAAVQAAVDTDVAGNLESLTVTANQAIIQAGTDTNIIANLESLTVTENSGSVRTDRDIPGALVSVSLAQFAAAVNAATDIACGVESVTLTKNAATVSVTSDTNINTLVEPVAATAQTATVSTDRDIATALEALSLTGSPATIALGSGIVGVVEAIQLTPQAAGVTLDVVVLTTTEALAVTAQQTAVSLGLDVVAALQSLTLTPRGATLQTSVDIAAALELIAVQPYTFALIGAGAELTQPGLEFTLPGDLKHFTLETNRLQFTLPVSRIHFTFIED